MPAFATPDDLETRWRPLAGDEVARASALLDDASAMLRAEMPGIDDRIDQGLMDPALPRQIVAGMVKRAMQGPPGMAGVESHSRGVGPFQGSVTFANPTGDLYLAKKDRKLLGIGRQTAYMVDTLPPRPGDAGSS